METETHLIYFTDDAPRVGSGWRRVDVKVGRKWVHLTGKEGRKRMPVKQWNALRATMERYHQRNGPSDLNTFWKV
jgi:hypothetical protein